MSVQDCPPCGCGPPFRHYQEEDEMDTDTSGGDGRRALGCAALVLGLILACIVTFYCLFYAVGAEWSTFRKTGERVQEVHSLTGYAFLLTVMLWVVIPVATALGALAMITRIRRWVGPLAAAMGIFTGILLAVDMVLTTVAWHLSGSI
jgi:hypothetical protein